MRLRSGPGSRTPDASASNDYAACILCILCSMRRPRPRADSSTAAQQHTLARAHRIRALKPAETGRRDLGAVRRTGSGSCRRPVRPRPRARAGVSDRIEHSEQSEHSVLSTTRVHGDPEQRAETLGSAAHHVLPERRAPSAECPSSILDPRSSTSTSISIRRSRLTAHDSRAIRDPRCACAGDHSMAPERARLCVCADPGVLGGVLGRIPRCLQRCSGAVFERD